MDERRTEVESSEESGELLGGCVCVCKGAW